jgi:heat shock protein HslJ
MRKTLVIVCIMAACLSGCRTAKETASTGDLCNIQWNLVAIDGRDIDTAACEQKPYIVFEQDGSYYGNFSCNAFFGNYCLKKQKIELSYSGATKMLCSQMSTEDAMMKALKKEIDSFTMSGNTLNLYSGKKETMRFVNGGKPESDE